jgi:hypothetical protein
MNARRNRLMRPMGFLALDGDVRFLGVDLFLGMRRHCRRALALLYQFTCTIQAGLATQAPHLAPAAPSIAAQRCTSR